VSYAYFINPVAGAPTTAQVDHLSKATLINIYSNANGHGTFTDTSTDGGNGVTFGACYPQTGSGTAAYWANNILGFPAGNPNVGVAEADAAAAAANCHQLEENGANGFQTGAAAAFTADAGFPAGTVPQVMIIPFSVGSWISQSNQVALDRSSTGVTNGVHLGAPDGAAGDLPYTGGPAPTAEAPNTTFYARAPYGRDLWLDVNNASLNGGGGTLNAPMRRILGFVATNYAGTLACGTVNCSNTATASGQICQAPYQTTTLNTFGFLAPALGPCGSETLTVINTGNGS
jgi:hypothetical protein